MWIIWIVAAGAGLLGAPWYAPAALSVVFTALWFAIAATATTMAVDGLMRLLISLGAIFAVWSIGRGIRHLAKRRRPAR